MNVHATLRIDVCVCNRFMVRLFSLSVCSILRLHFHNLRSLPYRTCTDTACHDVHTCARLKGDEPTRGAAIDSDDAATVAASDPCMHRCVRLGNAVPGDRLNCQGTRRPLHLFGCKRRSCRRCPATLEGFNRRVAQSRYATTIQPAVLHKSLNFVDPDVGVDQYHGASRQCESPQ